MSMWATANFLQDRVVASRWVGKRIDGPTTAILVQDTSREGGDKSTLFRVLPHGGNSSPTVTRMRCQVVRALDMGVYHEGLVVQLLPSRVHLCQCAQPRHPPGSLRSRWGRERSWTIFSGRVPSRRSAWSCATADTSIRKIWKTRSVAVPTSGWPRRCKQEPEETIAAVKTERPCAGGEEQGFPTGVKWELTPPPPQDGGGESTYATLFAMADEGDPGAFMDRSILEGDPHAVLEGLMIGGYAMGAKRGFFYIRCGVSPGG